MQKKSQKMSKKMIFRKKKSEGSSLRIFDIATNKREIVGVTWIKFLTNLFYMQNIPYTMKGNEKL